jgi:kynureninase
MRRVRVGCFLKQHSNGWAWTQGDLLMLESLRDEFVLPPGVRAYLCGNSLGLQPKATRAMLLSELDAWAEHAVEGHFRGPRPWLRYHEFARDGLSHVLGANAADVVAMNSLTVNLHLLMASFFRPRGRRRKILIEAGAFPSDRHAVLGQLHWHQLDPIDELVEHKPDAGELYSTEAILAAIDAHADELALVLWPGVQYRTGQAFDLHVLSAAAKRAGAMFGADLAHAVGNVAPALGASDVDFAVWCSYKYLNSGAGAVAGAFVNPRHAQFDGPRLSGWWGHEVSTRFQMGPEFVPTPGADGWQVSNPPVLALAPLLVSLEQFQRFGIERVAARGRQLSARAIDGINALPGQPIEVITPRTATDRGAQLSLRVAAGRSAGRAMFERLIAAGIVGDWREPDVIRVAFPGLYAVPDDVDALLEALQ